MKKLKISASFLCLCVVIILTSLAFFYQKGNTTDGTVGSDSPDKENTLKPSASKGSDEFVNDADASEHSQSSHAEIDYSTYESTTLGISISYPAALQDIMAIAEGESYEGFISGQLNPITCIYLYPAEDTTYSQDSIIAQIYWLLAEEKGPAIGANFRFSLSPISFINKAVNNLNLMAEYDSKSINCGFEYSFWKD